MSPELLEFGSANLAPIIGGIPEAEATPSKSKFGSVSHGVLCVLFSSLSVSLHPSRDTSTDKNMPLSDKPFSHAMATQVDLDHMKTSN